MREKARQEWIGIKARVIGSIKPGVMKLNRVYEGVIKCTLMKLERKANSKDRSTPYPDACIVCNMAFLSPTNCNDSMAYDIGPP